MYNGDRCRRDALIFVMRQYYKKINNFRLKRNRPASSSFSFIRFSVYALRFITLLPVPGGKSFGAGYFSARQKDRKENLPSLADGDFCFFGGKFWQRGFCLNHGSDKVMTSPVTKNRIPCALQAISLMPPWTSDYPSRCS